MMLKVTDIKQYIYCPRILYYQYCFPVEKKNTAKMDIGKNSHNMIENLEKRRQLKKYNLTEGVSFFEKYLVSDNLGLSGKIDRVLVSNAKYYPVDYKNSDKKVFENHIYQLTGYALLLEDIYKTKVDTGFIYLILSNKIFDIYIEKSYKDEVKRIIDDIRFLIDNEFMPEKADNINKCIDCEYRRFCNDIE